MKKSTSIFIGRKEISRNDWLKLLYSSYETEVNRDKVTFRVAERLSLLEYSVHPPFPYLFRDTQQYSPVNQILSRYYWLARVQSFPSKRKVRACAVIPKNCIVKIGEDARRD